MKLHLTPSWTLSDEHATSSYGKPVLVDRETGEAYGPGDIVQILPGGGYIPGYIAVRAFTEGESFSAEELAFIDLFLL
jgi:hypothetical protein